ncbi:alpha/beta hydrolase [Burkholderiales bacterium]|nr:alpha/beta hydrolase [Burkholderiales bacterium]
MPFFSVDQHRIFYTDTGGDKPALIFSHGFFLDQSSFEYQYDYFRENYRCIGWDEMGFGQSTTADNYSYWDSAEVILRLMDHLSINNATFVGVSKGGFISLRCALSAPHRVNSLVLIGSEAGIFDQQQKSEFADLISAWRELNSEELSEAMSAIGETYFGSDINQISKWKDIWCNQDRSCVNFPGHALLNRDDITDRLKDIACPTFVIHGGDDKAIDVSKAKVMASGLPNSQFLCIEGAPHGPNATHASVVNEVIEGFLAKMVEQ